MSCYLIALSASISQSPTANSWKSRRKFPAKQPKSSPPVLDGASFDAKLAAAQEKSYTDFALWGGLTPGNLDHMEELAERGVVGFKAFMCDSGMEDFPRADDLTLYRGMKSARHFGL